VFRSVLIKKASKLQYIQGYLTIYDGDLERKVFLKDITLLMIEAKGTLVTVPLLIELMKQGIAVVFCDEKHNPAGTLLGYHANYRNSGNIQKQIKWNIDVGHRLWKYIVQMKISMQRQVLELYAHKERTALLQAYQDQVEIGDRTNREGLAAKVYFHDMFSIDFKRSEESVINSMLNYGYSILLSCFNREIVGYGYLTQLGIFHIGKSNPFNLTSDFMEPFRPIADIIVHESLRDKNPLKRVRKLLTKKIMIDHEERYLDDAIRVFTNAMLRYMNEESDCIPILDLKELEHYSYDESYEINRDV
jgi:CRISP-associated protein Cas1